MRIAAALAVVLLVFPLLVFTQTLPEYREPDGGGSYIVPGIQCLDDNERALILEQNQIIIEELIKNQVLSKQSSDEPVLFDWPLRLADHAVMYGYHGVSNFVDHNLAFPNQLLDYMGGRRTYDLENGYNHKGTDYFLWPFSWNMMDDDVVEVVAVAPGTIIQRIDGNYDRNCSFGAGQWNAVYVRHDDGSQAWYGHLKEGSVTAKQIGQRVERGEYLGVVGSSGNSTGPHLHLEIYDAGNNLIDPYAGPYNSMNENSWWSDQREYYDSAVNDLRTHFAPPEFRTCPAPAIRNESNQFNPGERVYFVTYYRDQRNEHVSKYTIYRPDNSVYSTWTHSSPQPHFSASFWYWWFDFPQTVPEGAWRFEVEFFGEVYSHTFYIGEVTSVDDDRIIVDSYSLEQNYPNPFNPSTLIGYQLPVSGQVSLKLYDILGNEVATLVDEYREAGRYEVTFDGSNFASGMYFYRMQSGAYVQMKKMVLIK